MVLRKRKVTAEITTDDFTDKSIELINVYKAFGNVEVLRGVSFKCAAGKTTCIIGPSGSGKSTALRCMNGLERPSAGQVLIGGIDLTQPGVNIDRVRTKLGMVFQHFNLFPHMTALANVTLALRHILKLDPGAAEKIAMASLDEVGLAHLAKYRPAKLSGGQKQRVAIARALAMKPDFMMFDEVTSALDPELVKGVLNIMKGLTQRGMTMVVVTHVMGFAREVANEVVFMDEGQVVEVGLPAEVLRSPESPRLRRFLSEVLD